jgi:cobyrinic acid a,c-diamide synthase
MIWLGGGYPEIHAAGLAATSMLAQLRRRTGAGWRFTPSAAA